MSDRHSPIDPEPKADPDGQTITPLPGEPGSPNVAARRRVSMSRKGLLAVGLLIPGIVAIAGFSIHRFTAGSTQTNSDPKLVRDQPTAATADPRKLDMTPPPVASAAQVSPPRIPALAPDAELAEPIGVRRTGSNGPAASPPKAPLPRTRPSWWCPPALGPRSPAPPVKGTRRRGPGTRTCRLQNRATRSPPPHRTSRATSANSRACSTT